MRDQDFQVSVIVPVYNAERFVRRAVESAVFLPEVGEVILVDDAGPDNALAVCRELETTHAKVRLLRHPGGRNCGCGASRNLGIKHAHCEFIAFLDADDYYLPNRFKRDREVLESDANLDGVYSACAVHYESESGRKQFHDAGYAYQEFLTLTGPVTPEEVIEVLFHCHPKIRGEFGTDCITVKKALLTRTGVFDEYMPVLEDIHLWRRLAAMGRLAAGTIDVPVAMRGLHDANRMTNRAQYAKYYDYWWEDLKAWFRKTPAVPCRARRAFEQAYCEYRVQYRPNWERRRALTAYTLCHPGLIARPYGFFDLNLFEAFGRNWWTLHLTSAKRKLVRACKSHF